MAERRAKNIICKSAKMKLARTKDGQRIVEKTTEEVDAVIKKREPVLA